MSRKLRGPIQCSRCASHTALLAWEWNGFVCPVCEVYYHEALHRFIRAHWIPPAEAAAIPPGLVTFIAPEPAIPPRETWHPPRPGSMPPPGPWIPPNLRGRGRWRAA